MHSWRSIHAAPQARYGAGRDQGRSLRTCQPEHPTPGGPSWTAPAPAVADRRSRRPAHGPDHATDLLLICCCTRYRKLTRAGTRRHEIPSIADVQCREPLVGVGSCRRIITFDTVGVTGSIPVSPTMKAPDFLGFTWSSQHLDLRSCGDHVVSGGEGWAPGGSASVGRFGAVGPGCC